MSVASESPFLFVGCVDKKAVFNCPDGHQSSKRGPCSLQNKALSSKEDKETLLPHICGTFKGGDPSAGSPTDTLLQLSPPRGALDRPPSKRMGSPKPHSAGLMGGVCKTQGLIHRATSLRTIHLPD